MGPWFDCTSFIYCNFSYHFVTKILAQMWVCCKELYKTYCISDICWFSASNTCHDFAYCLFDEFARRHQLNELLFIHGLTYFAKDSIFQFSYWCHYYFALEKKLETTKRTIVKEAVHNYFCIPAIFFSTKESLTLNIIFSIISVLKTSSDKIIYWLGRYSFLLSKPPKGLWFYILCKSSVRNLSRFFDIIKLRRKEYLPSQ